MDQALPADVETVQNAADPVGNLTPNNGVAEADQKRMTVEESFPYRWFISAAAPLGALLLIIAANSPGVDPLRLTATMAGLLVAVVSIGLIVRLLYDRSAEASGSQVVDLRETTHGAG